MTVNGFCGSPLWSTWVTYAPSHAFHRSLPDAHLSTSCCVSTRSCQYCDWGLRASSHTMTRNSMAGSAMTAGSDMCPMSSASPRMKRNSRKASRIRLGAQARILSETEPCFRNPGTDTPLYTCLRSAARSRQRMKPIMHGNAASMFTASTIIPAEPGVASTPTAQPIHHETRRTSSQSLLGMIPASMSFHR